MCNGKRTMPRTDFPSSSVMFRDGFAEVLKHCWEKKITGTLRVLTPSGFKTIESKDAWITATREIANEVMMDGMVKIRVDVAY
jgi:hypothetical protein